MAWIEFTISASYIYFWYNTLKCAWHSIQMHFCWHFVDCCCVYFVCSWRMWSKLHFTFDLLFNCQFHFHFCAQLFHLFRKLSMKTTSKLQFILRTFHNTNVLVLLNGIFSLLCVRIHRFIYINFELNDNFYKSENCNIVFRCTLQCNILTRFFCVLMFIAAPLIHLFARCYFSILFSNKFPGKFN